MDKRIKAFIEKGWTLVGPDDAGYAMLVLDSWRHTRYVCVRTEAGWSEIVAQARKIERLSADLDERGWRLEGEKNGGKCWLVHDRTGLRSVRDFSFVKAGEHALALMGMREANRANGPLLVESPPNS